MSRTPCIPRRTLVPLPLHVGLPDERGDLVRGPYRPARATRPIESRNQHPFVTPTCPAERNPQGSRQFLERSALRASRTNTLQPRCQLLVSVESEIDQAGSSVKSCPQPPFPRPRPASSATLTRRRLRALPCPSLLKAAPYPSPSNTTASQNYQVALVATILATSPALDQPTEEQVRITAPRTQNSDRTFDLRAGRDPTTFTARATEMALRVVRSRKRPLAERA
jgi:hypothetical protein